MQIQPRAVNKCDERSKLVRTGCRLDAPSLIVSSPDFRAALPFDTAARVAGAGYFVALTFPCSRLVDGITNFYAMSVELRGPVFSSGKTSMEASTRARRTACAVVVTGGGSCVAVGGAVLGRAARDGRNCPARNADGPLQQRRLSRTASGWLRYSRTLQNGHVGQRSVAAVTNKIRQTCPTAVGST